MKSLINIMVVCLIATPAFSVIDPDPDMLGIYFDMNAEENCLSVGASIPLNAYVILVNPTSSGISAYEFGLTVVVPPGHETLFFRLASNAACRPMPWVDPAPPLGGDYVVGLASPIPAEPATVLHCWEYMLLAAMPVEFFLGSTSVPSIPGDLPVVQVQAGGLMQVGLSTGGPDTPVATINTDCVVRTDEFSFGGVKALFR